MSRRHNKNLVSHPEDIRKTCSFPQTFPQISRLFLHTLPRRGMPGEPSSTDRAILWGVEETNYLKFYLFQVV